MRAETKSLAILVADDHAVVRRGVREMLDDEFPSAVVVEVASAQEALEQAWKRSFDLIILDITMPGRSGLDILRDLRMAQPKAAVLVQSMHAEEQFAIRFLRGGALGYITKDSVPEELVRAIHKVLSGGRYVSASLAERIVGFVAADQERSAHERLSDREFQVLRMLASGLAVKEIAADLSLSIKTISTYRTRILEKLNLRSNAELGQYALREGLVEKT
jgi:two-component system, NarL family, invasion response regulator UvrY